MSFTSETRSALGIRTAKQVTFLGRLGQMMAVARQRRQLADMDDHQLRDIGITRAQAAQESAKAPWDAPANWYN